jgi:hypothetical protein
VTADSAKGLGGAGGMAPPSPLVLSSACAALEADRAAAQLKLLGFGPVEVVVSSEGGGSGEGGGGGGRRTARRVSVCQEYL